MQTITVCTDAGHAFTHEGAIAGWAAYIRTPSKLIRVSGLIRSYCKGSTQAEQYAIANALHIVNRDYDISKYKIILYCDNIHAIRNHKDGTIVKSTKDTFLDFYNRYVREFVDRAGDYQTRHVKAHLPKEQWGQSQTRHFMQDWCDVEVHRIMKIERERLNKIYSRKMTKQKALVLLNKKAHN
jgi:hypothetical protein